MSGFEGFIGNEGAANAASAGVSLIPFVGQQLSQNIEASRARAYNSAEAQKNRDFQERMSNTALQRYVADANKAGLNPVLGLSAGGSSSPGGATASTTTTQVHKRENKVGQGLASALQVLKLIL